MDTATSSNDSEYDVNIRTTDSKFPFESKKQIYYNGDFAVLHGIITENWTEQGQEKPTLERQMPVAVKICFQESDYDAFRKAFLKLKKNTHENIVSVFLWKHDFSSGDKYDIPKNNRAIFMEAGEQDLYKLLGNDTDFPTDSEGRKTGHLTMAHCMSWIKQIASALAFLHNRNIVHRDVKPRNIIMFENSKICKLCDFDDSRELASWMTPGVGTENFMAPEVRGMDLNSSKAKYDEKCDCYSFGRTILAILFRDPDCTKVSNGIDIKSSCFKYESHRSKLDIIENILKSVLAESPAERFSSHEIYRQLDQDKDKAPDLIPMKPSSNKNTEFPETLTVRSTSRKNHTVAYEATLSNNSNFTPAQATEVQNLLNTLGKRVNGKVRKDPPDVKHKFHVEIQSDFRRLIIDHDLGSSDDAAKEIAKYCREENHLRWLSDCFKEDNDLALRTIEFSLMNLKGNGIKGEDNKTPASVKRKAVKRKSPL